ncbi:hypothetical protein [Candidatus Methylobacter oryzae]|uniref:Uncharacterized protein n=1 Tax=Candidatus Methylobacter oryzae TaxID=2497749 RepID=A0ABY3C4C9_9GAMM|nr:hypothetical protein [Candidatus Methylobacter oryzae]TRW89556.1 hypothetical protein EKO24_021070 [Candidatus Methylobacter oryzae]
MRLMPIAQLIVAFLPAVTAFADDNPTYKEGLLTIPSIDTAEQVGKYQDVQLKPTAEGTWQLLSLKETSMVNTGNRLTFAPIYKVEVITTSSFPTQVFLKLFGRFNDCGSLSPVVHQRFDGNHFEVVLNEVYPTGDVLVACAVSVSGFAKTIPLSVYGLKAGTYSYSVASTNSNASGLTGTFKLNADNASVNDSTGENLNIPVVCEVCQTQP